MRIFARSAGCTPPAVGKRAGVAIRNVATIGGPEATIDAAFEHGVSVHVWDHPAVLDEWGALTLDDVIDRNGPPFVSTPLATLTATGRRLDAGDAAVFVEGHHRARFLVYTLDTSTRPVLGWTTIAQPDSVIKGTLRIEFPVVGFLDFG